MKKTDKILVGIVSGILLLVVVAFTVALVQPKPTYLPDDIPEGVAFNYLFALQQEDYERAYSYLSPLLKGYPGDSDDFRSDIRNHSWYFDQLGSTSTTVEVQAAYVKGQRAEVEMKETQFYEGGLFDSSESTTLFTILLRQRTDGTWKIEHADEYWLWCWDQYRGC